MNKAFRNTAALVLASTALAVGVGNLVVAGQGQDDDPKANHTPFGDPDGALPDDVRRAKNWALLEDQAKANDEVIAAWNQSGGDARSLPRVHIQAPAAALPETLEEAAGLAEDVVHARVTRQEFLPGGFNSVTLEVLGRSGTGRETSIEVTQMGGPMPAADGSVVLAEAEWDPVLLVGDEVVVFLWKSDGPEAGQLVVPGQNFRVVDGVISGGPEVSPAAGDVVGRDVSGVLADAGDVLAP
ncbi:MAG: hypothetical protein ACRDHF_00225 [Tepidiformaceae bacterium]